MTSSVASSGRDTFALKPVGRSARTWLFALAVLLPLGITVAALGMVLANMPASAANSAGGGLTLTLLPAGIALLAALSVWWFSVRGIDRRHVALIGNSIEVTTLMARERIALAELDLARARIADLDERTELQPLLKLWGAGTPGFRSGWFLLRNRRRALVATAGGKRVLWLPTLRKFDLLLELQQPQAALDALRERLPGGRSAA